MFLLLNKPERILRGELDSTRHMFFLSRAFVKWGSPVLNTVLQIQIIDHKWVSELSISNSFVQWKSFKKQKQNKKRQTLNTNSIKV